MVPLELNKLLKKLRQNSIVMDDTELLRLSLTKLVTDSMGKQAGQLFYDFHIDDDADGVVDGAKALLTSMLGPEMAEKKVEEVRKSL